MRKLVQMSALIGLAFAACHAEASCESLSGYSRGDATVLLAQEVPAGNYQASDGRSYSGLGTFCRVVARAAPSPASNIVIELWLPEPSQWNGKLLGTGNGAFGGAIRYAALAGGLKRGYATANTDMGTYPASVIGGAGYDAGNGRPEIVKDWGYRATHEMTVFAKSLVTQYYDRAARRAYFAGCSTGGHQGLTEAQRFPDDYDAILAGAAGNNRTHLHAAFAATFLSARLPGAFVPQEKVSLVHAAVLKACAGRSGGLPGDAYLMDPVRCGFEPRELLCKAGQPETSCLTAEQVRTLETAYTGTRNPRTGALIYPAWVKGSESLLSIFFGPPGVPKSRVPVDLSRWVFGPEWDGSTFDFDQDMAREDSVLGPDVNALDPDLTKFAAHGGRLILFHGWADAIVSPLDSVLYYDRIVSHAAGAASRDDFVRLFLAPGVGHCAGGEGPDTFGQGAEWPQGPDADSDLLIALDRWVEKGIAPESVVASKYAAPPGSMPGSAPDTTNGPPIVSRPLCAYPKIAHYDSKGSPTVAASFRCVEAPPLNFEHPAPQYLQ